jgi:hypothetical protein
MAAALNPNARRKYRSWLHGNVVTREQTAIQWRSREAKYRAIADNCTRVNDMAAWSALADRCKTMAYQLEAVGDAGPCISHSPGARGGLPNIAKRSPARCSEAVKSRA